MIKLGTKVAVMPNNNCSGLLFGRTGVVKTIEHQYNKYSISPTPYGVLLDDQLNPLDCQGLYWFSEHDLAVIQDPTELSIKKVIFSGPKTIILWDDGTKTISSCGESDQYSQYIGFCAAVAKKVFGSNNKIKKIIDAAVKEKEKNNNE